MTSLARVLFAIFLTIAFAPVSQGQVPNDTTVHVITTVDVAPASVNQALTALRRYRDAARMAAGNGGAELVQGSGQTQRFAIVELWADRMAYDAFKAGAASTQLTQALTPLQTAAPQTGLFRGLVIAAQRPGTAREVYAISRFAVIPARAADFGEMASALGVASRAEAGVLRYDIIQGLAADKDKFAILEMWGTQPQYDAHKSGMALARFREQSARLLDSAFEETLYTRIN
jgi:quinol monooxygenase YgiN